MTNPLFGAEQLSQLRDFAISAYQAQPLHCRYRGMVRELNEDEKLLVAHFDAAVVVLQTLDPRLINLDLLADILQRSVTHPDFESLFEGDG